MHFRPERLSEGLMNDRVFIKALEGGGSAICKSQGRPLCNQLVPEKSLS